MEVVLNSHLNRFLLSNFAGLVHFLSESFIEEQSVGVRTQINRGKRTVSSLPLLSLLLTLSDSPSLSPPVTLFDWRTTTATDLRFIMRMFEHNSLLSVLGVGEGEEVLDFHQCPALGLNKAIVLPGPERVQKGRQWIWLQKWAHSGHHAEQVPMIDCLCPSSCIHGRGLWVRWPPLNRSLNTRIHLSKRQREWVHRRVITWQWGRGELCDLHLVSLTGMFVCACTCKDWGSRAVRMRGREGV